MALSNVAGHHEQALARAADVHKLLNSSIFMHDAGRFCSPVSKAHHPWRLWWWIKSRPATPNVAFWPDRTPNSPQFHLQNPQWTPTTSGGHALSMDLFVPSTPFARSFPPVRRCLLRLTWLQRVAQPVSRPQYPLFHLSTQELAVAAHRQPVVGIHTVSRREVSPVLVDSPLMRHAQISTAARSGPVSLSLCS